MGTLVGSQEYEDFDLAHAGSPGVDSSLVEARNMVTATTHMNGRGAPASHASNYSGSVVPGAFDLSTCLTRDDILSRYQACLPADRPDRPITLASRVQGEEGYDPIGGGALTAPAGVFLPAGLALANEHSDLVFQEPDLVTFRIQALCVDDSDMPRSSEVRRVT